MRIYPTFFNIFFKGMDPRRHTTSASGAFRTPT